MKKSPAKKPKSRVFILESNEVTLHYMARLIDMEQDLTVCGESSGLEEALERLPETRPDVAVIDVDSLNGTAMDAFSRLRWILPSLPWIALSMRDAAVHGRRLLQAGAAGYLTKGEAAFRIIPVIRRVLRGGSYGLDSILRKRRKP
jgi:DNA-binding NarL/FixJ family response regulator